MLTSGWRGTSQKKNNSGYDCALPGRIISNELKLTCFIDFFSKECPSPYPLYIFSVENFGAPMRIHVVTFPPFFLNLNTSDNFLIFKNLNLAPWLPFENCGDYIRSCSTDWRQCQLKTSDTVSWCGNTIVRVYHSNISILKQIWFDLWLNWLWRPLHFQSHYQSDQLWRQNNSSFFTL